jgi:hypothetical protein
MFWWAFCLNLETYHVLMGVMFLIFKLIMFWWELCFESWNLSCFDGRFVLNLQTYHVLMRVRFRILKLIMFWWVLCFESSNLSCFDRLYVSNLATSRVLIGILFWISFACTLSCLEQVSQSLQILTISRIYNLREKLQKLM